MLPQTVITEAAADTVRCLRHIEYLLSESLAAHERRVTLMSGAIGRAIGLAAGHAAALERAAALHDIGKLFVPRDVLDKPGPLDAAEIKAMRRHSSLGHEVLAQASDPLLRLGATIARQHHEQWSGGGYPDGLSGESIVGEARIVAVCDIYDALRERRSYKTAMSHEEAMHLILVGDGRLHPGMFDPDVLSCVAANSETLRTIFEAA